MDIYIYSKKNSGSTKKVQGSFFMPSSLWFNNTSTNLSTHGQNFNIQLSKGDFETSGSTLYATFEIPNSVTYPSTCSYDIIKQITPTFNISPSSVTLACSDTSAKTFSVTNVYNTAGTKTYKWKVGSSWLYNGSPAPNLITSNSSSITLTPNTYPLSNVEVATILDNTQLPYSTSTINLIPLPGNRDIIGDFVVCSSEVLSINSLNSGENVTWTSSNTSIASISTSNNQGTVSAIGNGVITVTATISDNCGQQIVLTKSVTIGNPPSGLSIRSIGGFNISSQRWAQLDTYYPNVPNWGWNVYTFEWTIPNSQVRMSRGGSLVSIFPLSTGTMYIKSRAKNKCGYGPWKSQLFTIVPNSGGTGGDVIPQF